MSFWEGGTDLFHQVWGSILLGGGLLAAGDVFVTRGRPRFVPRAQRHTPPRIFAALTLVLALSLIAAGVGLLARRYTLVTWAMWSAGVPVALLGLAALWWGSSPDPDRD